MSQKKVVDLKEDQLLFSEGEQGREMFIILDGRVQVFLLRDEFQVVLATLQKGHFFGEMSLLEGESRSANVMALEPTKLLVIDEGNFQQFISQNPKLAEKIMKGLSQRLRSSNEQIFQLKRELHQLSDGDKGETKKPSVEEKAAEVNKPEAEPQLDPKLVEMWKERTRQIATEEQISCPVCQHNIVSFSLRKEELNLARKNYWFREYYEGVENLLFKNACCTQCYYAAPQEIFSELGEIEAEKIKESTKLRKSKIKLSTSPVLTRKQAIKFYQLVLLSLEKNEENIPYLAHSAMELSWLYRDESKWTGEREALKIAFDFYGELASGESRSIAQKSLYYQGLISLRLGNVSEGKVFLKKATEVSGMERTIVYVLAKKVENKLLAGANLDI